MMKLLFVEDDSEAIEPLVELLLEKKLIEPEPLVEKFDKAIETIKDIRPDVVILDIFDGDLPDQKTEGQKSLDFIWDKHFCPVIIYSALPEAIEYENHYFIHSIKKGRGSEEQVLGKLREIRPHINILRSVEEYVYETFSSVLKEVAQYAVATYEGNFLEDALRRATRRRLAAQMDEISNEDDELLAPWEQYLFPPISGELRLGDILKKEESNYDDPEAFRIVLTPSCDLEKRRNGKRKVENVLVSRCCIMKEGIGKGAINLMKAPQNRKDREKNTERAENLLSQGHSNGIIPLPALKGLIPLMAANLRDLQLVPANTIGASDSTNTERYEYVRVASLDSPFREMVSWAYLQIAGRPGLPNRDFGEWVKEILEEYSQRTEAES